MSRLNRRIKNVLILIGLLSLISLSNAIFAGDGWQIEIKASVLNAENRLSIGQRPDATDGIDGRYDIPALLSGDIMAYIELVDREYWKDIKGMCEREACTKNWDIIIDSDLTGENIKLNWNPHYLPSDMNVTLADITTGNVIDMKKQSSYVYKHIGKRKFRLEVKSW
jgi:hypothetical protein